MKSFQSTVRRNWRVLWSFLAPVIDISIVIAGYILASVLSSTPDSFPSLVALNGQLAAFALFLLISSNLARGLYRKFAFISLARQIYYGLPSFAFTAAIVFNVYFLLQNRYYPIGFLVTFFLVLPGIYLATWVAIRILIRRLGRRGYGRWRTMLIGSEEDLGAVSRRIENHPELGYDVREVLHLAPFPAVRNLLHVDVGEAKRAIDAHDIELIIFSSAQLEGPFQGLMEACRQRGTAIRLVSTESDYLFSRARLRDFAGIPLYSPEHTRIEFVKKFVKRGMDLLLGITALILLSPLFAVVALLTKIESPGPVFFKQKRSLSDEDRPFLFFKFRTMHHLADERKDEISHLNEANGALFKVQDDPRVTRIGKVIRRLSIDELPQLFNVLKGQMSLVGPRPLPVDDFANVRGDDFMGGYFRERAKAKPGMTGLWQISGRSDLGFRELVLLDLYYIENHSIIFDLEILLRTIPIVILGKGAY